MNKIYHLSTCDTCKKILAQIPNISEFELQDIKSNPVSETQLQEMFNLTGSYEQLFSKRAQLYKQLNLKEANLLELDFKKYLLEHYTFLARPVIIYNAEIIVRNNKKTTTELLERIKNQ